MRSIPMWRAVRAARITVPQPGPMTRTPALATAFTVGRSVWLDLLAVLWPTECVGCRAPDRDLCGACAAEMERLTTSRPVPRANVPAGLGEAAPGPPRTRWQMPEVPCFAAAPYAGVQRELLIGLKHAGRVGFARRLGPLLARALAEALEEVGAEPPDDAAPVEVEVSVEAGVAVGAGVAPSPRPAGAPLIVCVPSRPARVRQRGYRHVEVILSHAVRALRRSGGRLSSGAVLDVPRRPVRALRALPGRTGQVGLTSSERVRNAQRITVRRGARARVRGRRVVVVDDVVTTGATVTAACETLRVAGAKVVAVAAVCRVERRDTRGGDADPDSDSA